MNFDISILHHLGLVVKDMDTTIARYEQLGFSFTPVSFPRVPLQPGGEPELLGAGNRCAIFQNNYLEILAVIDREQWEKISIEQGGPFDLDQPLSRYEGLHVMHLGTDDLEAVYERFQRQGTSSSAIAPFQRLIETPEGMKMMQAQCLSFPLGSNPEALCQIAQHLTPELVLQPRYMHHRNGAKNLTECLICTIDPQGVAAKYERYSGHKSEQVGEMQIINLGSSRLLIFAPEQLERLIPGLVPPALPYLAGFTVAVADLAITRQLLNANQIPFQEEQERLVVRPQDACGCAVIFEKEGVTR